MIGSLLYLMTSKPDIAYAVGMCIRFQSNSRVSLLVVVKRIIKYVHGTSDFGVFYLYDTNSILVGYCDVDSPSCSEDRKSTLGGCFFLGNNLISWFSKKQNCVCSSRVEAEYIVAGSGYTQLMWMKQMLNEYGIQ
ncbi:hypothetical protein IC575_008214 [Cucumis melo]